MALTSVPRVGGAAKGGEAVAHTEPAADGRAGELNEHRFEFTGNAREYFGIFIVNAFLTVVTLGIYSAWAKVRTRRYFYGSTYVDGHSFEYLAQPPTILKARAIVLGGYLVLNLVASVFPPLALLLLLGLAVIMPVLLNRGMRFNARMSAYRNVRFDWTGTPWRTFLVLLAWPAAVAVAAFTTIVGIALAPFASRAAGRYRAAAHRLGVASFAADPPLAKYFQGLGVGMLLFLAAAVPIAGLGAILAFSVGDTDALAPSLLLQAVPLAVLVSLYPAYVAYRVFSRNALLNTMTLDGRHRFRSDWRTGRMVWILLTNAALTLVSLGLLLPWARIRQTRYEMEHTALLAAGPLDDLIDEIAPSGNAAAAEYMDMEGFDAF